MRLESHISSGGYDKRESTWDSNRMLWYAIGCAGANPGQT